MRESVENDNAMFVIVILIIIGFFVFAGVIRFLESRDVYFTFTGIDMTGYDIPSKTSLSMSFSTDCDEWCDNEPSCQAYVVTNNSFCTLKSSNKGVIQDDPYRTLYLRQTPDIQSVLGSSFTSIYPNTCITDSLISTMNYLSPIDCMTQCIATPSCVAAVITTTLSSSPYTCFLHSGTIENVSNASYTYLLPINDDTRLSNA